MPVHLYGELARHEEGVRLLAGQHCLPPLVAAVRRGAVNTEKERLELRGAIYALGHFGDLPCISALSSRISKLSDIVVSKC